MVRFLVFFIVFIALTLHNLPLLIRDQAVIWLLDNGAEKAGLTALDVDWLKGKVHIKGLYAQAEGKPKLQVDQLEVDLDYELLSEKRILISELRLEGVDLGVKQREKNLWLGTIDLNQFSGEKEKQEPSPSESSEWSFGLANMRLNNVHWRTDLPGQKHHLALLNATVADFYLWDQQQPVRVDLEGSLNGAPIAIESSSKPLPEEKSSELHIKLNQFPVHSVTAAFIPSLRAHVDLDLNLSATTNLNSQLMALKQSGNIKIRDFSIAQNDLNVKHKKLNWQGDLQLSLLRSTLQNMQMTSKLELGGLQLKAPGNSLNLSDLKLVSALEMEGMQSILAKDLAMSAKGILVDTGTQQLSLENAHFRGDAKSEDLKNWQANIPSLILGLVELSANNQQLVTVEKLQLDRFKFYELNRIELATMGVDNLKVMGDGGVFTRWNRIQSDGIQFNQMNHLNIANLALSGSKTRLHLSQQRTLPDLDWLLANLASPEKKEAETKPTASEPTAPFRVSIGSINLSGNNPVSVVDKGVKPSFKTDLNLSKLVLKDLDTASKGKTSFSLNAKNGFSTISAKGAIELFSGNFGGNWDASVKGLGLPQVSPYSLEYTGYYMHSGQLSLDTKGTIKSRKLKGDMDIRLNKLEVEARNSDRSGEFDQKVSMPLGTAIAVLQDNDDNIDLQIPVDGSLDDPQFGYQTVINKLAGKGLKSAAMGYLSQALQPFGALISIGQMVMDASDKGSFINLQPVFFGPASSALDAEDKQYLAKLSGMMKERKGMRMNICGLAVAADEPVVWAELMAENKKRKKPLAEEALKLELSPMLQQLAEQRSNQIKGALVKQGIDIERLFSCYPKVDLKSDEKPQVTLGL
ncbi:DUF748 domain-containing protein [Neptuniibacter caesariensis]|uniref:DUF748 domain-containing protein n=1 Tax=Neptuniibacter caesariensis TaxID=207954 RepID=A0A7U8C446_NEPCE|nr:DUF748 domain-containing protein [Neptuniibacter caesariensis]EAR61155.1 hypothetical protein MED92_04854 [Oceanospirillum sp. MED92] [Neptuniibacter caesariensis]